MRLTLWLAIVLLVGTLRASDETAQLRAALRAWSPGRFGTGSVVKGPLNVTAVEQESLLEVRKSQCPKVPFGCAHEYWEDMKRMLRPGDALVFFRTDTGSWGDEGYAIVRRGRVIKV